MSDRYVPFVQQPYCCVPASFQIVMYRRDIPLLSQEELAYKMGLIVPEKDAHLFTKVRTGSMPSSGWGTQIQKKQFNPNIVFPKLGIPLKIDQSFIKDFRNQNGLKDLLLNIQKSDDDALLCFDYGKLWGLSTIGGHVCVFDFIDGDTVHLIDPERNVPKYRKTSIGKLFEAMDFHGDSNSAGVWRVYMPTVYVPMSADIIHPGHIELLKEAKRYGKVIVGLLSDEAIKKKKDKQPIMTYDERFEVVNHLKGVTKVIEQSTPNYESNLQALKPELVVHGDDWSKEARQSVLKTLKQWNGKLVETDYSSYSASSTLIKKRVKDQL